MAVRAAWVACGVLLGSMCAAQPPSLAAVTAPLQVVRARCARLATYAASSAGVEREIVAQALDDCRAEVARLTPRRVSKWEKVAGYMAPALAAGQVTYAAKHNADWLIARKRQKNAGQVEFNLAGEIVVDSYLIEGLAARFWRGHRKRKRAPVAGLQDAVTDAVLLPR